MLLRWIQSGLAILAFLVPTIGGSLLLYALRAGISRPQPLLHCQAESFILGNNVLLAVSTLMILLGTIYPLVYEARQGDLRFQLVLLASTHCFSLMGLLLVLLMVGHETRWRETNPRRYSGGNAGNGQWRWR